MDIFSLAIMENHPFATLDNGYILQIKVLQLRQIFCGDRNSLWNNCIKNHLIRYRRVGILCSIPATNIHQISPTLLKIQGGGAFGGYKQRPLCLVLSISHLSNFQVFLVSLIQSERKRVSQFVSVVHKLKIQYLLYILYSHQFYSGDLSGLLVPWFLPY